MTNKVHITTNKIFSRVTYCGMSLTDPAIGTLIINAKHAEDHHDVCPTCKAVEKDANRMDRCPQDIGNLGRTGSGIGFRPGPNAY